MAELQEPELGQVISINKRAKQFGALDLGSNSFHLVIAKENHGRIQILDRHKETVRLAEGLTKNKKINKAAEDRALACLMRFSERLQALNTDDVRAVGTSAFRRASNSKGFLKRAEKILGKPIEIVSGHEEARLIYLGVCSNYEHGESPSLVVDIGGGSTEIILGEKLTPTTLDSLNIGCITLSQKFFPKGRATKKGMDRAINQALAEIEPVKHEFLKHSWNRCLGASGTVNTAFAVASCLMANPIIDLEALNKIAAKLIYANSNNGNSLEGVPEDRQAVFPGGLAILIALFRALNIDKMEVSEGALREGLLQDMVGRSYDRDTRELTVSNLADRYRIDRTQSEQVRDTVMTFLSQVAITWELTETTHKNLLSWSSALHEIGMDISHAGYQKHGGYLIENLVMPGFSKSDQSDLARIVRNHRRKFTQDDFGKRKNSKLLKMTILLRLAALLHRGRNHEPIPHIQVEARKKEISLSFSKQWLEGHPLTLLDLENETNYLKSEGVELVVKTH